MPAKLHYDLDKVQILDLLYTYPAAYRGYEPLLTVHS
jgi:hypothetical protein